MEEWKFKAREEGGKVTPIVSYQNLLRSLEERASVRRDGLAPYLVVWLATCLLKVTVFGVSTQQPKLSQALG